MVTDKSRENRARKVAERRGYRLEKSRRRDPLALGFGLYQLLDASSGGNVSLGGGFLTLSQVEEQLEVLAAVQDPSTVEMIRAVAALAMALSPLAGLDPRTVARLAGPVTAAANLLGDGTAEDLAAAVRDILEVAEAVAPPDVMTLDPLIERVRNAYGQYEAARGRLARPLTRGIPTGVTRPLT